MTNTKDKTEQPAVVQPATVAVIYTADVQTAFTHDNVDYILNKGEEYTLPNIPFVQSLIGQERLTIKP